jgi:Rps23 Pro-64 3,4-dihydroxylase Tpa1-like proline 4-hydroxylase
MINSTLDIDKLKKEFKKLKKVRIIDFLDSKTAARVYNWFNTQMPDDWWYLSTMPKRPGVDLATDNERMLEDYQSMAVNHYKSKLAHKAFDTGTFSYSFKRTIDNHVDGCTCIECEVKQLLNSKEVIEFLNKITDYNLTEPYELFASKYEHGDFLSIHHDGPNGRVGFVLNLTKDWRADYGGLLNVLTEDYSKVTDTIIPGYNTLTLFDSSTSDGFPHFVSHVNVQNKKRISYTGWYR